MREVIPGESYFRIFEVGGQAFAYSNNAELWKAPVTNDAGEVNSLSNADSEGGWWNPSPGFVVTQTWWAQISEEANPLQRFYLSIGEGATDPRHLAIYTRTHIDPSDTNIYAFYSAKFDRPESILLTVIDTDNGSTNPADWTAVGQEVVLQPELDWEGINNELLTSQGGRATGVQELRDPYVFEDDKGTASTLDDELYLFYTGAGEEAIGVAKLDFNITPLLGDVNLDGAVSFLDISPFISVLSATTYQAEADMDQNGIVDFLDISPFIAVLGGQ